MLAGTVVPAVDVPPPDQHQPYLAKYAVAIKRIGSDSEHFAQDYSVPMRIRITKVRGF